MRQIYFIQNSHSRSIKIGVARNVAERLSGLQSGADGKLEILLLIQGTHRLERAIHNKFAHLHRYGEWFEPASELLEFIQETKANGSEVEALRPGPATQTHCKQGHALTEDNRTLDGKCRTCGNRRSLEYQRRKSAIRRELLPKDGLCAAELHPFVANADGICKECSNETKQRWLDNGNREEWNRNRRRRRNAAKGNFDSQSGEAAWGSQHSTHCKNGHEFSGDNLYINPKTKQRVCRACVNQRSKDSKQRKFAETQGELNGVV